MTISIRFLSPYFAFHNSSIVFALGPFTVSLSNSVSTIVISVTISVITVGHTFEQILRAQITPLIDDSTDGKLGPDKPTVF